MGISPDGYVRVLQGLEAMMPLVLHGFGRLYLLAQIR